MTESETEKPVDEVAVFVLHEHYLKTIEGETFRCPRASWRKEMQIISLLKDLIQALIRSGVLGGDRPGVLDPETAVQAAAAQARIIKTSQAGDDPDPNDIAMINKVNQTIATENMRQIVLLLQEVMETGPEKLTEAAVILTGKEREWIEQNLESEQILSLVLPFLAEKKASIGRVLGKYSGLINQTA